MTDNQILEAKERIVKSMRCSGGIFDEKLFNQIINELKAVHKQNKELYDFVVEIAETFIAGPISDKARKILGQ